MCGGESVDYSGLTRRLVNLEAKVILPIAYMADVTKQITMKIANYSENITFKKKMKVYL